MHRFLPLVGLLACASRTRQPTSEIPDAEPVDVAVSAELVEAVAATALQARGVSCDDAGCVVLTDASLLPVDRDLNLGDPAELPEGSWLAVHAGSDGPTLLGTRGEALVRRGPDGSETPLARPARVDQEDLFALRSVVATEIQRAIDQQGRMPFLPLVPPPGGGVVLHQVARGDDAAAWMRIGGAVTGGTPAPGSTEPPWSEVPLALHPTGSELYATPWPEAVLQVLDPMDLSERWTVEAEGPLQGLFVDPTGRLLVLEEGAPGTVDPFQPPPTLWRSDALGPVDDLTLALSPRIGATHTVVVDLRPGAVAARLKGAFRGLARTPEGDWLLATSDGVARLTAHTDGN